MRPIALDVEPDEVEDLLDLQRWLRESDGLAHRLNRVPRPDPERLGTVETLVMVLASAGTVELVRCLREWIRSRRREISVTVKNPSGEVRITATNFDDDSTIIAAIGRMIEDE